MQKTTYQHHHIKRNAAACSGGGYFFWFGTALSLTTFSEGTWNQGAPPVELRHGARGLHGG